MFSMTAFWEGFTRLGEAQILLFAALLVYAWTLWRARAASACTSRWLLYVGLAAALTTLTKVAFIGWGLGSARWDFTGLSGHAMFAAAILPVLGRLLVAGRSARTHQRAIVLGYLLAALVAISRVQVQAHSVSEALGGFLCGSLASGVALGAWRHMPRLSVPLPLMAGVPLLVLLAMHGAPPSRTHDWVTRLSLTLSGQAQPCTRELLHTGGCRAGETSFIPPPSTPDPG